jgi:SAM-dependent methyltransferase
MSSEEVAPIHAAAARGFARSAAAYDRGRPGYPRAAVDWLAGHFEGTRVIDLAAGTGKLTRALAERGLDVVAVEPVAEMRAAIAAHERVRVLDGRAEAIALADGWADAVTVAQAFHWFDGPRALAEIHRVLRPGGLLALVFNRRRMEDEIQQRIAELLAPHRGDVPAHATAAWRGALDSSALFGAPARGEFDNVQLLDAAGLADRFGSVSFVATLDEASRGELLGALCALAGGGRVTLRYRTEVEVLRRCDETPDRGAGEGVS